MEIKNSLQKPYTEEQRIEFIFQQNHINRYEIKETDDAIEAWGYTEEETEEEQKQSKVQEINAKIAELEQMVTDEILFGNESNVQVYREVIQGLKDTRDNL